MSIISLSNVHILGLSNSKSRNLSEDMRNAHKELCVRTQEDINLNTVFFSAIAGPSMTSLGKGQFCFRLTLRRDPEWVQADPRTLGSTSCPGALSGESGYRAPDALEVFAPGGWRHKEKKGGL